MNTDHEPSTTSLQLPNISRSEIIDMLNMLDVSVIVYDLKWRYVFLNRVSQQMVNLPESNVIGENIWKIRPMLNGTAFKKAAYKAMRTQEQARIEEYYPHLQKWFKITLFPTKTMLVIQIINITELKAAENIVDKLNGDLRLAMEVYWLDENRVRRGDKNV